jgi:hypothetical protein
MNCLEKLRDRRTQIFNELAKIEQFRKGSITNQVFDGVLKDGTPITRGPYPVLSTKVKGKTVSMRISDHDQADLIQTQINDHKRFKELVNELVEIGEQISNLFILGDHLEKKTKKSKLKK